MFVWGASLFAAMLGHASPRVRWVSYSGTPIGAFHIVADSAERKLVGDAGLELFSRFVQLGAHARFLRSFVEQCLARDDSMVLIAVASSLNKLLGEYTNKVVAKERLYADDPTQTDFAQLWVSFHADRILLPAMSEMAASQLKLMSDVSIGRPLAAPLLSNLVLLSRSGDPHLARAFGKIAQHAHRVWCSQMDAWLTFGRLLPEAQKEWMVVRNGNGRSSDLVKTAYDGYEKAGLRTNQSKQTFSAFGLWNAYALEKSRIPLHVRQDLAESIFFIGNGMKSVLNVLCGKKKAEKMAEFAICRRKLYDLFGGEFTHLDLGNFGSFGSFGNPTDSTDSTDSTHPTHPTHRNDKSSAWVFPFLGFEHVIGCMRKMVAEWLWTVVVQETELVAHVERIWYLYLLGDGDAFQEWVEKGDALFGGVASATSVKKIKRMFSPTMSLGLKLIWNAENAKIRDLSSRPVTMHGWEWMTFVYKPEAPLDLVLDQEVMESYSKLFSYLLIFKRVSSRLRGLWLALTRADRRAKGKLAWVRKSLFLRYRMSFVVDQWVIYCRSDILEPSFNDVMKHLGQQGGDISLAHQKQKDFVAFVCEAFFFQVPTVSGIWQVLCDLCTVFCDSVHAVLLSGNGLMDAQLNRIQEKFEDHFQLLYRTLGSVSNVKAVKELGHLLFRLDDANSQPKARVTDR